MHSLGVAVGALDDEPLLQVAFGVRGATLRPDSGATEVTYTLRVRLVALDGNGRVIASIDSTQAYRGPAGE